MDSPALTSPKLLDRLLPFGAIVADDIRQIVRHWAFLSWAVFAVLLAVVWFTSGMKEPAEVGANPVVLPAASDFGGRILGAHLLLWSTFAIALGASTIASEAEIAPDAILCRGISRWQYFLGKCAARTFMVGALFAMLTVPALGMASLRMTNDLQWAAVSGTLTLVLLFLVSLTAVGVAVSAWFSSPLLSVVVAWMALYGAGVIVSVLELNGLSPVGLSGQLPGMLRGEIDASASHLLKVVSTLAFGTSLFSLACYSFRDA